MSINCGSCGTPLYHIDEACPNCLAGSRLVDRPPTHHILPCPQCARFREKLDREKIARFLCGGRMRWNGLFELTRDGYRSEADGLIAYLTEWEET